MLNALLSGVLAAGIVIIILALVPNPAAPEFQYDIEVIRAAQRECLNREPAHSFSLVQAQGGYQVRCEPIMAPVPRETSSG